MSDTYGSSLIQERMKQARAGLDALLRNDIGLSSAVGKNRGFIQGDAKRYAMMHIKGMSRAWDEDGARSVHARMRQALAGVYCQGYECYFCVYGDEKGVSYIIGAERSMLLAMRGALEGLLEDADIVDVPGMFPDFINRSLFGEGGLGGIVTGMPALPDRADKQGEWVNPARVVASGMRGSRFMTVFYCRAVSEDLLRQQAEILRNRQSRAAMLSELTLQGDDMHRVSETAVIYDYKQYGACLDSLYAHLLESQTSGGWNVAAYYLAGSEADAQRLASLLRACSAVDGSGPEPVRCTRYHDARYALNATLMLYRESRHPLSGDKNSGFYSLYTTQLSSSQLAAFCMLPDVELPGFYVNDAARFDLTPRRAAPEDGMLLGDVMVSPYAERAAGGYAFSVPDLDRHALVVGATGSGKSNTIRALLVKLYNDKHIPFMVIESAKSEYWQLANCGVDVCALQLGAMDAPFCLNPFECANGFPLQTHVDSLLSTFKAAFEMYPPMPFILEQSVYAVYADYGWDVATGQNARSSGRYPTLSDLYWQIPDIVSQSAYDREIKNNVIGSLQTRVRSLTIGGKGRMLDCRVSTPLASLLRRPLVLELENMGDDDIKAFVMGLLMTRLYEERRCAAAGGSVPFGHLLVIEEAHRLLKRMPAGGEQSNPRAASVEFFCNMLAEIRSYGQGMMIADQSPEKLAQDAVRNTNLKIVHRIVDARDRETAAGAMHMDEHQQNALSILRRGVAAVYAEGDHRPRLVKMPLLIAAGKKSRDSVLEASRRLSVFDGLNSASCGEHEGCRFCGACAGSRCADRAQQQRHRALAEAPLTPRQRRYYEDLLRRYGPDGALMLKIIAFAIERDEEKTSGTKARGEARMNALDHDALTCMAGVTLSCLDRLDGSFRRLCADRFENFLLGRAGK